MRGTGGKTASVVCVGGEELAMSTSVVQRIVCFLIFQMIFAIAERFI